MEKKMIEMTCIVCPIGCNLQVEVEDGAVKKVSGNTCPRGEKYAITEVTAPRRVLTSTVQVTGGHLPLCPVRTKSDIPKGLLFEAMKVVNKLVIEAPVAIGDVLIADICGTGVELVACREIKKV